MKETRVADLLVEVLERALADPARSSAQKLDSAFQVAAAYGVAALKPLIVERLGDTVASGPFAGMHLLGRATEGAYIPKLLGAYESELHAAIENAVEAGYDEVINIGCAEGYYAVGLARRMATEMHAFDIDPDARRLCLAMATLNGVQHRIGIGAQFLSADFGRHTGCRVLVVCDIEGDESGLLDPDEAPALAGMDMVVELHRVDGVWTSDTLFPRFEASHVITEFRQQPRDATRYPALADLSDRDRFFALLERTEETRWALFDARVPSSTA